MFNYAQLNDENIVIGISQLTGEVVADNMILINGMDNVDSGDVYDPFTQTFSPPTPLPEPEPKASIEEIAEETLLETKYQTFILEMMM